MKSLPPKTPSVNGQNKPFSRRGFRVHDPAASAIGAQTPSEQNEQAQQIARITDPVIGPAVPQDRVARYGPDIGA